MSGACTHRANDGLRRVPALALAMALNEFEVFGQWKAPAGFKVEFFVVRVGEWGGHMLVDCDDPLLVHQFCSMLPAFVFEARPVIAVEDAVRSEREVIAWRDGLKGAGK